MNIKKYLGSIIGIAIFLLCAVILYHKFQKIDINLILQYFTNIPIQAWLLACCGALIAYFTLALYDYIGLQNLGKKINLSFILFASFSTYAISHNIGASVLSGAAIRYRLYKSKNLSLVEIAALVAFCSFTFIIGVLSLTAFILIFYPSVFQIFYEDLSAFYFVMIGLIIFLLIVLYIIGSLTNFRSLKLTKKLSIPYPKFSIVLKQLIIAPIEILGAALIIYAVIPAEYNVSFVLLLGVFLASFSATLLSNAPAGGLGVLELIFILGLPHIPTEVIIASLLVFRLLYLIIPLFLSLIFIGIFEIKQIKKSI
ncbi:YbhN family protein [Bartonella sp. DGB1]|uniref:lysylphosphatidylglycerol synthase transmembrane domain-containing protein n=1 Tax=Bartonella sp. DGB1 TaxID=3239807 RepID=UPI0035263860